MAPGSVDPASLMAAATRSTPAKQGATFHEPDIITVMQISIHEVSSAKWPFDRDAEYYAGQGVHAMGVLRSKVEAYGGLGLRVGRPRVC